MSALDYYLELVGDNLIIFTPHSFILDKIEKEQGNIHKLNCLLAKVVVLLKSSEYFYPLLRVGHIINQMILDRFYPTKPSRTIIAIIEETYRSVF